MAKKLFLLLLFGLSSIESQAALVTCGPREILKLHIEGDRDDGHAHKNTMVITLNSPCNGRSNVYIKNSHPAFNSMVSLALAAYAQGHSVNVWVNSSKVLTSATEIAIMSLE